MSMPYAVSNLAVTTTTSGSLANARQRVLSLYRNWQKSAPEIVTLYQLDLPISAVRAKIREEFERNRYVEDVSVTDILIFKGQIEHQETMNLWKQTTHVMRYFAKDEAPPKPVTFLDRFYEGRD
ncbi:hypothetical protein BC936DRAFT_146349 [Jimgerdemannia flammicorona]|uniref:Uncharacterized protein n=2 Tax=Jimgerdemannia flammicorona TaxID=994334 RepID=A0A433DLN6_9FUNG|nr:hypothetical protein BC936DRAFT_146349 [Jimgerdemannia flammicorona]RUS24730.1 hypothetical protein BC938DRAFT_473166 [Jimgerdemannia flammicorona]